jgi:hypothetical protein
MTIDTLVKNIKAGDAQSSNNSFNSVMADKINAALDTHKQVIAQKMYGEQPVEEPAAGTPEAEKPSPEEAAVEKV